MIYAFTGLPGGGKSLTALGDFVLPQLMKCRHVFCNISGLSPSMIAARLSSGGSIFTLSDVNRYLHRFAMAFDDSDARSRRRFFQVRPDGSRYYADAEGLSVLLSELMSCKETVLVLDECHEYLCSENWKVLKPFLKYVSMARHYGHDIVLITQHITDVWEPLRNRVHETHDFVRGTLGIRSQYKERVFHGWNIFAPPGYVRQRLNDKGLYSLYASHEPGARERMGYMSIFRNSRFLFLLAFVLCAALFSSFLLRGGIAARLSGPSSSSSAVSDSVPVFNSSSNVVYVKYVVCGVFDCKATRPDGSVLTLPLDYASGRYPIEVRKYVKDNSSGLSGRSGFVPGSR